MFNRKLAGSLLVLAPLLPAAEALAAGRLAFMREAAGRKEIIVSELDGSHQIPVTDEGTWSLYPDLSADGGQLAYANGTDAGNLGIVVRDLRTDRLEHWTPGIGMHLHPAFSGDGRFLAFSGPVGPEGARRIAVIDLVKARSAGPAAVSGRDWSYVPELKVVPSDDACYFPELASDGSFLVMQRSRSQSKDIVRVDLTSGQLLALSDPTGEAMSPTLSVDDRYVAYTARTAGVWDLWLLDLRTGERLAMTATPFRELAPTFTADGGLIFASDASGRFALHEIPAAEIVARTFGVRPLVATDGDLYAPSASGRTEPAQSRLPDLPAPARSSFGAISDSGRIYVVGGHQGPEHTYPRESFLARTDIFDTRTGTWRRGADLTLARHGFGLAAHNGRIYAFGGFAYSEDHEPRWKSVDLVERYDPERDLWEAVGHLPRPRSSNVAAQIGGKVYLIGGWDSTPKFPGDKDGRFHPEIDVYDLETGATSTLTTPMSPPLRRAFTGVVDGERILLIGGISPGASHFALVDHVTAFEPATGAFRELTRLPFPTFAPTAGLVNRELIVLGGMYRTPDQEPGYRYVNHIYSMQADSEADPVWRHLGRYLSEAKGFAQAVDLTPGTLGVLGGHTYEMAPDGLVDHPVPTFELISVP